LTIGILVRLLCRAGGRQQKDARLFSEATKMDRPINTLIAVGVLALAAALVATITPALAAENYRAWTAPGCSSYFHGAYEAAAF
jgi:hypothetical protein